MTLCLIVSAYCGSHASLTNVSQIFKYTNVLLKRCSKIGRGDVLLCFQDTHGKWTKYNWVNWVQNNGRKSILNNVNTEQNICLQQLQNQSSASPSQPSTILNQLKECIMDCKQHHEISPSTQFIYHILLIGNEHCLSLNDDIYLNSSKSHIRLQEILSSAHNIPITFNMLCLCSPLKHKKYREFTLINNCCSVCNQQFFRTKPNKKQHFPKSCHQIALKQVRIQNIYTKCMRMRNVDDNDDDDDSNEPSLKRRKLNDDEMDDDTDDVDINEMLMSASVLFWQKLIDRSSGIFRWIFTDFNQANIDLVFNTMTSKIATHSKVRYISMGALMAQCMIFPGPNNEYFISPNNSNNKIRKFESLNEKQVKFEIKQHMKQTQIKYNNSFIKAVDINDDIPLNILQENNMNISVGCDIISVLGFLDRECQWIPVPVLSRHFVIPALSGAGADLSDIGVFVKELLYKYNKIGLVQLNAPTRPGWYGFIHSDMKSKGQYLLLDILSPYVNVEALLRIESKGEPTEQYRVPPVAPNSNYLNIFDSVAAHFPSETNIVKEFDKFVRLLKQKKILECFAVADAIRKRSWMFHIPHLIKHLLSIINKEMLNITFDLPKENQSKHQLDILIKLLTESQNDHRMKIAWNSPNKKQRHKNHKSFDKTKPLK